MYQSTTSLVGVASDSTSNDLRLNNFKPRCEVKRIKTRGAIVVLMWNYFTMIIYHFLANNNGKILGTRTVIDRNKNNIGPILLGMWIFYPLVGWLADVRIGRYKTIRCSVWIMWACIVSATAMVIVSKFYESIEQTIGWVIVGLYLVLAIGLSGFQANIVQFGVDQLVVASSQEIKAFVMWYTWTFASSGSILKLLSCIPQDYHILRLLLVAVSLTCAICVDFLFNSTLIKEPVTQNPLKLVTKVIRYAFNHKHPRLRSAFTYTGQEQRPTRMDLGKTKYGGPFTNEQVEDVKTFLRMCFAMSVSSIFIGVMILTIQVQSKMFHHFKDKNSKLKSYQHCMIRHTIDYSYDSLVVILIPLYEFIVYPVFHKCIPNVKIMNKFLIGMILVLVTVSVQMTLEVVGHATIIPSNSNVTTAIPCVLRAKDHSQTLNINYLWLLIPEITVGLAVYTLALAALQFVCAQAPYSMKGILFGYIYFINGVSTIVTLAAFYPFSVKTIHWTSFGCGLWFFLSVLVIALVTIVLFSCIIKWYKKRERDDGPLNEHTFAINYWQKYGSHTQQQ